MAKMNTTKQSVTKRIIVYGAPKTGKSQLAGELSNYYDLIWVDMEKGRDVLYKLPPENLAKIELIDLPDTRSYPIGIETCLKLVKGPCTVCNTHGKVDCPICKREHTDAVKSGKDKDEAYIELFVDVDLPRLKNDTVVVFDSLTQLTNSAIANITKGTPDDYKLMQDDWGNLGKLLDIFLSHIQQAGYHVVVISHETEAETEGKKKKLVPVGGTRNFSRNVAKYFTDVVYGEIKNGKHVFYCSTVAQQNVLTGSRSEAEIVTINGYASMLAILNPELAAELVSAEASLAPTPKTATSNAAKASDLLARFKK